MTTIEFSDYLDVQCKLHGFVLDDYEKSLLLTLCQEQIVEDLYSNENSQVFEETEKRRRYLSNLVYSFEAYRNPKDRPKFTKPYADKELVEYDTVTAVSDDTIYNYSLVEGDGNQEGVRNQERTKNNENNDILRSGIPIIEEIPITKKTKGFHKIKSDSSVVTLPENLLYIVYEQVTFSDLNLECLDGNTAVVTPITHDEYYRAMQNPFRRPNERRVFRLDVAHPNNEFESEGRLLYLYKRYQNIRDNELEVSKGYNQVNGIYDRFNMRDDDRPQMIELISKYKINTYFCRYIKRPNPIVVNNLPEYLTVYGFDHRTESEVHPALHKVIAENAVKLAVQNRNK
jgi:hypothetical protein